MPTYDYVCQKCGHRMEVIHSLHGHGPSTCPVCGGQMRKAFAPPAVVFKGTGWARKELPKRRASLTSASSESKESKSDAAKDAPRPEAKKDEA